jgi:PAS domain S-box-containing protein
MTTYLDITADDVLAIFDDHGEWRGEVIQYRKDGAALRISAAVSVMHNAEGQPIGAMAINRDVTDISQAKDESRRTKAEWEIIFDAIRNPTVILDKQHNIIAANKATIEAKGSSVDELVGSKCWSIFHADDCHKAPEQCPLVAMAKTWYLDAVEMEMEALGGTYLVSCTPLHDDAGKLDKIIHIATDITERKRLEDELRQVQKMETVGQLAGGVAHDFNNILMPIISYSEMILEELPESHPHHDDVNRILSAAESAKVLTRQLLTFSRKQVIELKPLDLNKVIHNFEPILRRTIREDIAFTVRRAPEPTSFDGDVTLIEQVLMNLAVNARDAMIEGGKLTFEVSTKTLDEQFLRRFPDTAPGLYAVLTVTDTGCGMDEATLQRAFEPFFTTKSRDKGTGLGLATVYGIVKQHSGLLWVSSAQGEGTTFTLCFPSSTTQPKRAETPSSPTTSEGRGTVLVVEDDPLTRTVATRLVKKLGYEILVADDGPSALKLAAMHDGTIHLLLTDVIMPKMNGKELREKLRKLRPETKALYMSGYADAVIARHGVLDDDVGFLQKPFSLWDLAKKVREALDG